MTPIHTKTFPILSRGAPSPGSNRHFQSFLDTGTTTFNPDAIIKDFYRTAGSSKPQGYSLATQP